MDDDFLSRILQEMREDDARWLSLVRPGDYILCDDTKRYAFSRHRYTRKGKLYRVQEVDPRGYVIVYGDYTEPGKSYREKVWLGPNLTIRNGDVLFKPAYMLRQKEVNKALKQYNQRNLPR